MCWPVRIDYDRDRGGVVTQSPLDQTKRWWLDQRYHHLQGNNNQECRYRGAVLESEPRKTKFTNCTWKISVERKRNHLVNSEILPTPDPPPLSPPLSLQIITCFLRYLKLTTAMGVTKDPLVCLHNTGHGWYRTQCKEELMWILRDKNSRERTPKWHLRIPWLPKWHLLTHDHWSHGEGGGGGGVLCQILFTNNVQVRFSDWARV